MKKLKYIVHYDVNDTQKRNYVLAATNKVDYIISVMNDIGYDVDIISPSMISKKAYYKGGKIKINEKTSLIKLPAFKWGNKLQKIFALFFSEILFCLYLLFNLKKDDEVVVYHSLSLMRVVSIAKAIKRFKLILEVEEIYSDVINPSEKKRKKEIKFLSKADKYIFPTEFLDKEINEGRKPYVIIHGTYKVEEKRDVSFDDDKIHVVYAGTFDKRKGGAFSAIEAFRFLPGEYVLHVLGFGSNKDTMEIIAAIDAINCISNSQIIYEGLLSGQDYTNFLQKCHIGLSTQNPCGVYNNTSFPSKILSYMANGLRVVTVEISVVKQSAIGEKVCFYKNNVPEEIANAITGIDLNDKYDGQRIISNLHESFVKDISDMLEEK